MRDDLKARKEGAYETGCMFARLFLAIVPTASVFIWPWFWEDYYLISGPLVFALILSYLWVPDWVGAWAAAQIK